MSGSLRPSAISTAALRALPGLLLAVGLAQTASVAPAEEIPPAAKFTSLGIRPQPLAQDRWEESPIRLCTFDEPLPSEPLDEPDLPLPMLLPEPDDPNPEVLRPPRDQPPEPIFPAIDPETGLLNIYTLEPPLGYTGRSGIIPRDAPESSHFVPLEDRWRQGFPEWDRYGREHPPQDDYPYSVGRLLDPYHQNVLKGDYPFLGQHTFLNLTATSLSITEGRQVPTPTTPFESTFNPGQTEFFGEPDQLFHTHFLSLTVDLFHGDAAFKPFDWRFLVTPVFNYNHLGVAELGIVSPNVSDGRNRNRQDFALQDWFVETKLADLSADYDFLSLRAGSQLFVSDFRGFI